MIIRTNKADNPYVRIDKTGITDDRLSWKARGILCYLLSKPDDWQVNIQDLQNHAADGRDSCRAGLRELEALGYMIKQQRQDENGHFKQVDYIVFETPELCSQWVNQHNKTGNGKTASGKPGSGSEQNKAGSGKPVSGKVKSGSDENEPANGLSADGLSADGLPVDGKTVDGKSDTTNKGILLTNELTNLKKSSCGKFVPPTQPECTEWLIEHKQIERSKAELVAYNFWSFYESKSWMVGKNKMSKWPVALGRSLGWEQNKHILEGAEAQTMSIGRANELFQNNDLGGTNATGMNFYDVFERVSGEGRDMRLRIRDGKQHLIKNRS